MHAQRINRKRHKLHPQHPPQHQYGRAPRHHRQRKAPARNVVTGRNAVLTVSVVAMQVVAMATGIVVIATGRNADIRIETGRIVHHGDRSNRGGRRNHPCRASKIRGRLRQLLNRCRTTRSTWLILTTTSAI